MIDKKKKQIGFCAGALLLIGCLIPISLLTGCSAGEEQLTFRQYHQTSAEMTNNFSEEEEITIHEAKYGTEENTKNLTDSKTFLSKSNAIHKYKSAALSYQDNTLMEYLYDTVMDIHAEKVPIFKGFENWRESLTGDKENQIPIIEETESKGETVETISANDADTASIEAFEAKLKEMPETDSCLINFNGTEEEWAKVLEAWDEIPEKWRTAFAESGWKVICVDGEMWSDPTVAGKYSSLVGLTNNYDQYIYIDGAGENVDVFLAHEMGHFVDWYYDYPSYSEEFETLFETESEGFEEAWNYCDQARDNAQDYFAICWMQILKAPETESSAPGSFAFVKNYY